MTFNINTDIIDKWRAKQLSEVKSDSIPDDIDVKDFIKVTKEKGLHIFTVVSAIFMLIGTPILVIFLLMVTGIWVELSQGIRIFGYLIIIGLMRYEWKQVFMPSFKELTRKQTNELTRQQYLVGAGFYFQDQGDINKAAQCFIESLTLPFNSESSYGGSIVEFLDKQGDHIKINYKDLLSDLSFVETFIGSWMHHDQYARESLRSKIPSSLSDSKRLIEFASIMHEMGKNQKHDDGSPHKLMSDLKNCFFLTASNSYKVLDSSV
jgi:hypothetical protein